MKDELIVKNRPKSTISEDFRTVRTNLEFASVNDVKSIMITSSNPGEGKSFVSINLATAYAQNDKKVLLMDCDLRLGRLHKIFKLSNQKGLSNLILKVNDISNIEEYVQKTDISNLYVLTRGTVPPNPSELLSSSNFTKLLKKLETIFDVVVLDACPVNGLSDSLVLSKEADKVIIVSKYGTTNIEDLEETKKSLENVGANIAGVILNKTPRTRKKYGNYYFE